jgi:disulfide bond formation protein DsbB
MTLDRPKVLLGIAAAALGAIGLALVAQYGFDKQPCPWCALQRLIYVSIAVVALLGLAWRSPVAARALPLLLLLLCGLGIATALWQHFVAAASASCNLTLADRVISALYLDQMVPAVFQPRATCADAAVDVLGVPFEFWSVAMFALIEAAALWLFVARRRPI